jgi:hypothetical protein
MDPDPVLVSLIRRRCRFVVVGSVARLLLGEPVCPSDLDVVIDFATPERPAIVAAMMDVGAHVLDGHRLRPLAVTTVLPWRWSWSVATGFGCVDLIGKFIDGSGFAEHDRDASIVRLGDGSSVRCHPTRHLR